MPTRVSVFPVVFGVTLVALSIAYYHRKSFYSEVWEKHQRQAIDSPIQAIQFQTQVKEGLQRERQLQASNKYK